MVEIRPARPDEARAIAAVHVRSWQVAYEGLLPSEYLRGLRVEDRAARYRFDTDDLESTLVAVDDGNIRGFIHVGPSRDEEGPSDGEVSALYVSPDSWREKIGSALMVAGRAWLEDQGYCRARLWVLSGNERAESFYRADGWARQPVTRSEIVWGVQVEEILYLRLLP
jgi:GNAT superfamily N-acetyltransferase